METPRELWRRLVSWRGRAAWEREMEEEMRFHLERQVEANVRVGMDPEEAARRARVAFGGEGRFREEARDEVRPRLLEDAWQDARYAARSLRRAPVFAAVAVVTLGLGIGANTAVFSAVSGVLLRPLPFAEPERLVMLWEENPERGWHRQTAAPANVLDWREGVAAFEDVAAYADFTETATLTGAGEPVVLPTALVTGNFFSVLGVRPLLGRALRDEETWRGGASSVVIGERLWSRAFGRDPAVVGRTVRLDGESFQVVGVMPASLTLPGPAVDAWRPFAWDPASRGAASFRRAHWLRPVARLRPGATHAEADAQLQAVARRLQREYPETNTLMGAGMTPLHDFLVGDTRTPLLVVFGAVGLLLLLACLNVGNLLLVRASARRREVAVRGALGAAPSRLLRQMVTEAMVLSAAGAAVGLAVGVTGTRLLERLRPEELLSDGAIALDWRVLAFTLATAVGCGLLFGTAPAVYGARARLLEALKEGGRGGSPGRGARVGTQALVVAEVALALLLVAGAGLLGRSFARLQGVDPGFDARGVLTVSLDLPSAAYDTPERIAAFWEALVERVEALPGVETAGTVRQLPLTTPSWSSDFTVDAWVAGRYGTEVLHREVSERYFETMRVPLVRGRGFSAEDAAGPPVVVVNEAFALQHFPGDDPLGRRIAFTRAPDSTSVWRTVVGVVGSERQGSPAAEPRPEVFAPLRQEPTSGMTLVARTATDPVALAPAVRRVLAELDPEVAPASVRTMEEVRSVAVARERFLMALLAGFGAVALVLAMVGVYGVIAQAVRARSREIGIRLALGARPGVVLGEVVRQGLGLVGVGIAAGVLAALFATRALRSLLYQVDPADPATLAAVAALLALAGVAAALAPARRASRTDPATVLRE